MKILKAITKLLFGKQKDKALKTDTNKAEVEAFMTAVFYEQTEEVKRMLSHGVDVNSKNEYGNTALMW